MYRTRSTLTNLLLSVFALPAPAEVLPELLKPVDPAVESQLMAKSNFDFRQDRYLAYRFRIVDISWELLDEEGARFTITPFTEPVFADLAVTVQTQTLDRDTIPDDLTSNWVGEILDSAWLRQGGSNFAPVSIWITTGHQEVTLKAARKNCGRDGGHNAVLDASGTFGATGDVQSEPADRVRDMDSVTRSKAHPPTDSGRPAIPLRVLGRSREGASGRRWTGRGPQDARAR